VNETAGEHPCRIFVVKYVSIDRPKRIDDARTLGTNNTDLINTNTTNCPVCPVRNADGPGMDQTEDMAAFLVFVVRPKVGCPKSGLDLRLIIQNMLICIHIEQKYESLADMLTSRNGIFSKAHFGPA
jgi:hypothetical protein